MRRSASPLRRSRPTSDSPLATFSAPRVGLGAADWAASLGANIAPGLHATPLDAPKALRNAPVARHVETDLGGRGRTSRALRARGAARVRWHGDRVPRSARGARRVLPLRGDQAP